MVWIMNSAWEDSFRNRDTTKIKLKKHQKYLYCPLVSWCHSGVQTLLCWFTGWDVVFRGLCCWFKNGMRGIVKMCSGAWTGEDLVGHIHLSSQQQWSQNIWLVANIGYCFLIYYPVNPLWKMIVTCGHAKRTGSTTNLLITNSQSMRVR